MARARRSADELTARRSRAIEDDRGFREAVYDDIHEIKENQSKIITNQTWFWRMLTVLGVGVATLFGFHLGGK